MGIFAASTVQNTAPGSGGTTKIFDANSSLYAAGATLTDVTIVNAGTVTVFLGSSTVTAAHGLRLDPGVQVTLNGYRHVKGDTNGDIYAITSSGTGAVEAGLATVDPVA
jgi:hypothetical protein